jgi:short-subunit dehydrogenase involved in D-alanine esterification of teichoic acids
MAEPSESTFPSTVFVVGGTSGIGRSLAGRLRESGRTVIVGGRNRHALEQLRSEGYPSVNIDVRDAQSVRLACDEVISAHPSLGAVITMAGVVIAEDIRDESHITNLRAMLDVNVMGTALVINAVLPHLLARGTGRIVTVGSAGAFVPSPRLPGYAASKAAVHLYTEVLRVQLSGTGIDVVELIPPPVAVDGSVGAATPDAMTLEGFVDAATDALLRTPVEPEIVVDGAREWRYAEREGTYAALLRERVAKARLS